MASSALHSIIGLGLYLGLPLIPLELLGLLPLRGVELRYFFLSYMVTIGAAMYGRYLFWKWRLRGQLV